jgi:hypothetical protein
MSRKIADDKDRTARASFEWQSENYAFGALHAKNFHPGAGIKKKCINEKLLRAFYLSLSAFGV